MKADNNEPCLGPGPGGELLEELCQRPQAVSVRLLDSSTAAVSWAPSSEKHNGSVVSVVSMTCLKPSLSQRMENTYCSEVTMGTNARPRACHPTVHLVVT